MLSFPVYDLFLLCASVSPFPIVTGNSIHVKPPPSMDPMLGTLLALRLARPVVGQEQMGGRQKQQEGTGRSSDHTNDELPGPEPAEWGWGTPQQCPPLAAASPPDPDALTYTVQHQELGSDQWTALATGLRKPGWSAMELRKGVQHIFRVLSATIKSSSKPSPPSEPVQLLERGEPGWSYKAEGWELLGRETGSPWWRLKSWFGYESYDRNSTAQEQGGLDGQSAFLSLLKAALIPQWASCDSQPSDHEHRKPHKLWRP